jgi:hypothetical protein
MENATAVLDKEIIGTLKNQMRGEVILPSDASYDDSRKVYNGMIDKYPAIIARCTDTADVIQAVNFGREHNLLVAVRGGGHNVGGLGICNDGLVIDLSGIKYVRVDVKNKTVRVGGGNTWGEVDHATHAYGLAVPAGIVSTTGVGGLTLGGGIGYLSRKYGLTVDNLIEADMVLADGSFVTVGENQNEDLFWAIRGGGGNFGIVTSFLFNAHPVHTVVGGPTFWPIERTEEILQWYDGFIHSAPEELNGIFATLIVPGPPFPEELHNKNFCGVIWCYAGDMDNKDKIFEPILKLNPIFANVGPMPLPVIQSMFDGLYPPGLQHYWRADFFNELHPEMGKLYHNFGLKMPTTLSQMHLFPLTGAAKRKGNKETPWAYRDAKYSEVIVGVDTDPANASKLTQWCKDHWEAMHPYSAGGGYTNFMMEDEGQDRVKDNYRENYDRLAKIKRKYDPDNFFRVNQNIKPE